VCDEGRAKENPARWPGFLRR